jgi:hypothetical protein
MRRCSARRLSTAAPNSGRDDLDRAVAVNIAKKSGRLLIIAVGGMRGCAILRVSSLRPSRARHRQPCSACRNGNFRVILFGSDIPLKEESPS